MLKNLEVAVFFTRPIGVMLFLMAFTVGLSANSDAIEREIAWTEDYESAIQRAASTNSVILLHFYGDYCPPCKLLDKKTFHDPALVSSMNEQLVTIKINADRRRDLAQKYQVTRWPTDVYLYPNGDEIYRGVSNADPAVYCKTIERVVLRHRDWTVERNSIAKAKERRQDRALAANTPQIQQEPLVSPGSSGRSIRTQDASWPNSATSPQRTPTSSRVIVNPYLNDQPIVVPPATPVQLAASSANSMANSPMAIAPMASAPTTIASTTSSPSYAAPIINSAQSVRTAAAPIQQAQPNIQQAQPQPPTTPAPYEANPIPPAPLTQPSTAFTHSPKQVDAQLVSAPAESMLRRPNATNQTHQEPITRPNQNVVHQQVIPDTIGLGGFCPVTLIESLTQPNMKGWVEGKKSCAVRHRGRIYYCASEGARQTLLSDPDRYTPCLSGFDIVQLCKEGVLRDGKCEFGCIQEGTNRVFLFQSKENYDAFAKNSDYYSRLLDKSEPERVANETNGTQIR